MAKTKQPGETEKKASTKKTFEERLERLEELGDEVRRTDIPLDDAIKAYEEGIKLARALEKELKEVESRVEIVMNDAIGDNEGDGTTLNEGPVLGLFDEEE
jgi:exodeoxyribonuclease VII small subunit